MEWLTLIHLIDPYCAVALTPLAPWRMVGNFALSRLFQNSYELSSFSFLRYDPVSAEVQLLQFQWKGGPARQLSSIEVC